MSVGSLWRQAGRVILLDPADRVFLLNGTDITLDPPSSWWFTPGGGCEDDETHAVAARREAFEELGIDVGELVDPVYERNSDFMFEGLHFQQHELYYVARVDAEFLLNDELWSEVERRSVIGARWWSLAELRTTQDTVYPEGFPELLERVLAEPRQ